MCASTRRRRCCSSPTVCSSLGPAQTQHPTELVDRRALGEDLSDLLQTEAHIAERHDLVQPAQLVHVVEPVAIGAVDPLGLEEPELVVVAEHAGGHLSQASELSDVQHDKTINRPSHGVKVKWERVGNGSLGARVTLEGGVVRSRRGSHFGGRLPVVLARRAAGWQTPKSAPY